MLVVLLLMIAEPRGYEGERAIVAPEVAEREGAAGAKPTPPPIAAVSEPVLEPRPSTKPQPKPWLVGAFVDVGYALNTNFPDNHVYRGVSPTPRTGEFTIPAAGAYVGRTPVRPTDWHMALALHFGAGVDALYSQEPEPGGEDSRFAGAEVWKHIAAANAGVDIKSGTELTAGLMASPIGLESFWAKDNWHVSTTWLGNGTPFYLLGGRIGQDVTPTLHIEGWVVNGWQTAADANEVPSYLLGLTWHKRGLRIAQRGYAGPEGEDIGLKAWRLHSDTKLVYWSGRVGVGAIWDVGGERQVEALGNPLALWMGGALQGRVRPIDRQRLDLEFSARPEVWWDRDGRLFGAPQWLYSMTATTSLIAFDAVLFRLEYRYDRSTAQGGFFFHDDATANGALGLASQQSTVFLSVIAFFERAFRLRKA